LLREVFTLGSASRQLTRRREWVQSASNEDDSDQAARWLGVLQFACPRGTFCKSQCNQRQERVG
jgi:hypothetical protein